MNNLKLLGFLENMELAEKKLSSTNGFLYHKLTNKNVVAEIIDVKVDKIPDAINIIKNYSPNKEVWMFNKMLDVNRKEMRSRIAEKHVNSLNENVKYNATLQIGSMFKVHKIKNLFSVPKFSYHDNNLLAYLKSAHGKPYLKNKIDMAVKFEKDVYENLDAIFTMTEYLRQSFIHDFKINESKVHNIGFGTNMDIVFDIAKEYDRKTILFVARDSFKEKGGYVLLDAFKKIRYEIKDARLLIVGQNINSGIVGVECIGFIDKRTVEGEKMLGNIYRCASLFIMPSYVEAAGNVFLEAMSFKVPCIGADVSAMPEIICGNNCGMVIPPGDSNRLAEIVISLLKDEKQLKEYGNNGFKAIMDKYNWDIVCNKFIKTVEKFI